MARKFSVGVHVGLRSAVECYCVAFYVTRSDLMIRRSWSLVISYFIIVSLSIVPGPPVIGTTTGPSPCLSMFLSDKTRKAPFPMSRRRTPAALWMRQR